MERILKYIIHLFRKLDISPISPGGLSKEFIILFWGINAVVFLANGLIYDSYAVQKCSPSPTCESCTLTKKIDKADLYTEEIKIVNFSEYIIISFYNFELPDFDIIIVPSGRAPPSKI